ncbi:hypothetical protein PInf_004247 [Phytophthora infestans]|nr:hypothetical protein PInf_004247 [Phytophthora infestans]
MEAVITCGVTRYPVIMDAERCIQGCRYAEDHVILTSDSFDGDHFLFEMEGSDGSDVDSSGSFGGERLLQEIVEGSDNATDDEGTESVADERFLVEMEGSESADGSEGFDGARFLQEVDMSESGADDSSESVDDERFLAYFESEEGSESGSA